MGKRAEYSLKDLKTLPTFAEKHSNTWSCRKHRILGASLVLSHWGYFTEIFMVPENCSSSLSFYRNISEVLLQILLQFLVVQDFFFLNKNLPQTENPVSTPKQIQIVKELSSAMQYKTKNTSLPFSPKEMQPSCTWGKAQSMDYSSLQPLSCLFVWWKCWKDFCSPYQTQFFLDIHSYEQVIMGKILILIAEIHIIIFP